MVHTAQQVVVDDSDELVGGFLDRLQRSYGVGVEVTDLQTDEGLEPLSDWVREHTGGLVEKTAIQPDPYLLAVLRTRSRWPPAGRRRSTAAPVMASSPPRTARSRRA